MQYRVFSPAKINEFLSVGAPDQRGFHPIETVFQEVSIIDEIRINVGATAMDMVTFERGPELAFEFEAFPSINTVTKALMLLRTVADFPPIAAGVFKRIPSKSGLGGGSSNAAAMLRFVQHLTGNSIPDEKLREFAVMIGADVAFFLNGGRAFGSGYGEMLRPLNDLPTRWLVIARPYVGCATTDMYKALDNCSREFVKYRGDLGYNDFERVAPCESLDIIERLSALGAVQRGLTGSGSAAYGIFTTDKAAQWACARLLEGQVPYAQVCQTVPQRTTALDRIEILDPAVMP
jgi:4-diphosphocytidyl-2-C-methyl-D-erythritol kinase